MVNNVVKAKQDLKTKPMINLLSDKVREEFQKWLLNDYRIANDKKCGYIICTSFIDNLVPSMQYGVLVDYFDSVGIDINVHRHDRFRFDYDIKDSGNGWLLFNEYDIKGTRDEARKAAIQKADELRNNDLQPK